MAGLDSSQVGLLPGLQIGNKMTDSTSSLTDISLEQAALKLQEIERENLALKDNLRMHNTIIKRQYDSLTEWRKKENDKFEQTKALITALRAENQELQVKVMTLADKEVELTQQVQTLGEDKAHLQRQKAMSDQRLFNVLKVAEEQGFKGLTQEDLGNDHDLTDAPLHASISEKNKIITKLEAALAGKEEMIAQLRADVLKKEQEVNKCRDTTKQLLEDMEAQQKLKESIAEENRTLTKQIMQAEQKLHRQMQAVISTTKREIQAEQLYSAGPASAVAAGLRLEKYTDNNNDNFSFPENVDDLLTIAKSLEAKQREEVNTDLLMKNLDEERKNKLVLLDRIEKLEKELQEMQIKQEQKNKELEEVQQRAADTAAKLAQDYDKKLTDMAKNSNSTPIQASNTEDVSILRSQVLSLIREVDETQNKLSAAKAALHHKDSRIMELEHINQTLKKENDAHIQDAFVLKQHFRSQISEQEKSQQENSYVKSQYEQLQYSFSTLVTDYKELQETFETYRLQMERQPPTKVRKETMEEINRLTAQVIAADEAIAHRDDQLAKVRNEMDENIQLLQFQADLYRSDFTAEREARNMLAEEKNKLIEENTKLLQDLHTLQEQYTYITKELESYNQRQINLMQRRFQAGTPNYEVSQFLRTTPPLAQDYRHQMQEQRQDASPQVPDYRTGAQMHHAQDYREPTSTGYSSQTRVATPGRQHEEELPSFQDYECPSCAARFPDIDSLQLHVPDCIDSNR
ncbi:hypothetical protein BsWGS_11433 [Bradybaena similaris]